MTLHLDFKSMYIDKMVEYQILDKMLNDIRSSEDLKKHCKENYDVSKMMMRHEELIREFLEPYAINSDLKK